CVSSVQTLSLSLQSSYANLSPFVVDIKNASNSSSVYYNNNQMITYVPYPVTINPNYNGAANFTITDNRGCVATYNQTLNMCLINSVNYITANDLFQIYPNPNNGDYFMLSTNIITNDNASIDIIDIVGKVVYNHKLINGNTTEKIELPYLVNGSYLVKINYDNNYKIGKINIIR
ncbi:MAG: T9SS type A sorting domain-containing protein, partial [Burkholderiales bacterium]|nr:T9SS type A sorting domain-containing protein [Bacteroidia bacterium]